MNISDLGRLLRTVRHLQAKQIWGRVVFKLRRPKPDLSSPPAVRAPCDSWTSVPQRQPNLVEATVFSVFGGLYDVSTEGWDSPHIPKLTRYNLHYFDDLNAVASTSRLDWHKALIQRWINENEPGKGSGWEPYPLSLRIVNWIKWSQTDGVELPANAVASLATQVRFLHRRLEWHLLGNHLFVNAKALVFAGLFFEGREADTWLKTGLTILERELSEQILIDGGQFELSPMYHALAVEDVLDLINITRRYQSLSRSDALSNAPNWTARLPQMLRWLRIMSHPDGRIAFFNDAAFGITPEVGLLEEYARNLGIDIQIALGEGLHALPESGYWRLEKGPAVAILDLAAVGPDYLPAHAHADTLSFELSLHNNRLIVNSGTSVYGTDAERHRQRGTRAHSTLCIDEQNSSEVWGGFRVGRRAMVSDVQAEEVRSVLKAGATHDGYTHLSGSPLHHRSWNLEKQQLIVTDKLDGRGEHSVEINFYLNPAVEAIEGRSGEIDLFDHSGKKICVASTSVNSGLRITPSTWHPEFGQSLASQCLRLSFRGVAPLSINTIFEWVES